MAARILIALILMVAPAAAQWPWEHARHRHHRVHAEPKTPPDCAQINEAVAVLDKPHLARALKKSTLGQRAIIEECAKGKLDPW